MEQGKEAENQDEGDDTGAFWVGDDIQRILLRVQVGCGGVGVYRRCDVRGGCTGGWCSGGGVISVHNIVVGFLIYLLLFDSIRW